MFHCMIAGSSFKVSYDFVFFLLICRKNLKVGFVLSKIKQTLTGGKLEKKVHTLIKVSNRTFDEFFVAAIIITKALIFIVQNDYVA